MYEYFLIEERSHGISAKPGVEYGGYALSNDANVNPGFNLEEGEFLEANRVYNK